MREMILDTETTGLDPAEHRLVEIACIELVNHLPTGRSFQRYLNPEREMTEEAQRIHGLTDEFLADKPKFADIVDEFLEFVGDAALVIHNADFDMGFLNAELARTKRPAIDRARATDTVTLARRKFPGQPASLDALCQRFAIDNTRRTLHGALLDAELLAEVYLELIGGRQATMMLVAAGSARAREAVAAR
ncbi:MAG: DNA polymerase III subunit epsilon, partial [Alphaproteobacteria bacterium]|nr:DNA polymerase III subunit epsilon [Alphaproteobacteria bacterium]